MRRRTRWTSAVKGFDVCVELILLLLFLKLQNISFLGVGEPTGRPTNSKTYWYIVRRYYTAPGPLRSYSHYCPSKSRRGPTHADIKLSPDFLSPPWRWRTRYNRNRSIPSQYNRGCCSTPCSRRQGLLHHRRCLESHHQYRCPRRCRRRRRKWRLGRRFGSSRARWKWLWCWCKK